MPIFYIIEENNEEQLKQEVHYEGNRHLRRAYNLLVNNLINNIIIINDHNNESEQNLNKEELKNFLLSHYNGNIYINGLSHYLEDYKKQYNQELDIDIELAHQFDQFYFRLTINVNDRFHEYQPMKFLNLTFGKIIV